jgi:hypothetical protein
MYVLPATLLIGTGVTWLIKLGPGKGGQPLVLGNSIYEGVKVKNRGQMGLN